MTVKAAQARVNLANIIENQLGYPIHKASSAKINHASDDSYSAQGQQQLAYQIKAQQAYWSAPTLAKKFNLLNAKKILKPSWRWLWRFARMSRVNNSPILIG